MTPSSCVPADKPSFVALYRVAPTSRGTVASVLPNVLQKLVVRDSSVFSFAGLEIRRNAEHRFDLSRKLPRWISFGFHGFIQGRFATARHKLRMIGVRTM